MDIVNSLNFGYWTFIVFQFFLKIPNFSTKSETYICIYDISFDGLYNRNFYDKAEKIIVSFGNLHELLDEKDLLEVDF